MDIPEKDILAIAALFPEGDRSCVRPFLRAVQARYYWVPQEALEAACERFGASYPSVYEEASLNPEFSLEPKGEVTVAVCRGLACAEAQAMEVLRDWEKVLGIKEGGTTQDGKFSLCSQNCFGRCAIGPNVKLGDKFLAGQQPGNAIAHLKTFH